VEEDFDRVEVDDVGSNAEHWRFTGGGRGDVMVVLVKMKVVGRDRPGHFAFAVPASGVPDFQPGPYETRDEAFAAVDAWHRSQLPPKGFVGAVADR
jgi:hypothetical protein